MRPGERGERDALLDFFTAAGWPVRTAGEAVALRAPGPPARETTRILGLYDLRALDDLEPFFAGQTYWVSLDPAAGLDRALLDRGFEPDYPWQKFERGVEPYTASTGLRIGEADERFGEVFAAAYGLPPEAAAGFGSLVGRESWHTFAAYDGDDPVAVGALYAAGDTGWLGMAGTLPAARGHGGQNALLAARIDRGRELGLRQLVTETGAPGEQGPGSSFRNIVRAGFRPAYVRPNYRAP